MLFDEFSDDDSNRDGNRSNVRRILILIVTWNKKEYVLDLLRSVHEISYPEEAIDILVVDNDSRDGTADAIATGYSKVHILRNPENLGGTGGFNAGLQWAFDQDPSRYDYIWLLDNDVVVHHQALRELVCVLEENTDAAIAGSTMMQLDYPWRINETGASVNLKYGNLVLNNHRREISWWKHQPVEYLRFSPKNIATFLGYPDDFMDVDYVAAASLLVRADIARSAGLWLDFFIHYDDVEWCLRISRMGYRILVSFNSVIWHMSAVAKVPTWIQYYDSRNALYFLKAHGNSGKVLRGAIGRVLLKALYCTLIGKPELGRMHLMAVDDFKNGRMGKKELISDIPYSGFDELDDILSDPSIKSILLPWTICSEEMGLLIKCLEKHLHNRSELHLDYLSLPDKRIFPRFERVKYRILSMSKPLRRVKFLSLYRFYDLVIQSDYQLLPELSFAGKQTLFVNTSGFHKNTNPDMMSIFKFVKTVFRLSMRCAEGRG
jgi:GT2 family glycosyltransferase